jgi:hypothetical protein
LAIGIGGTSAAFAALDAVLWKALPVSHPRSLVCLWLTLDGGNETDGIPLSFVEQLRRSDLFSDLAVAADDGLSFTYDGRAERVVAQVVSASYRGACVLWRETTGAVHPVRRPAQSRAVLRPRPF